MLTDALRKDRIKLESRHYDSRPWYNTSRGRSAAALCLLIGASYYLMFAALLVPLAYFVWKGRKAAMLISGAYSVILIAMNIVLYIQINRNEHGEFQSSTTPILLFVILGILIISLLKDAYMVERSRSGRAESLPTRQG
jgi:hypothetical protein